jgi:hypothetical protein
MVRPSLFFKVVYSALRYNKDLGKLVDNFDVNDETIQEALGEHNEEHLAIVSNANNGQNVRFREYL